MPMMTSQLPSSSDRPRRLGPYVLTGELGRGAFGVVYKANHAELEREVALKVIPTDRCDRETLERFAVEARLASRLDDPGIARVTDCGVAEGQAYYAMELCTGPTLQRRLSMGPLNAREAVEVVCSLARTVARAHAAGILHRDLKPANVLLDATTGRTKITDFGLARDVHTTHRWTQTGDVMGTPSYMAPEQFEDAKGVDQRADVYALGAILYECLCGRRPYQGRSLVELALKAQEGDAPPPSLVRPGLPTDLDEVALRALHPDLRERTPSAETLVQELERWLRSVDIATWADGPAPPLLPPPPSRQRRGALAASLVLSVGAMACLALALLGTSPRADLASAEREGRPQPSAQGSRSDVDDPARLAREEEAHAKVERSPRPLPETNRVQAAPAEELARLERRTHELRPHDPQLEDELQAFEERCANPNLRARALLVRCEYLFRRGRYRRVLDLANRLSDRPDWVRGAALRLQSWSAFYLGLSTGHFTELLRLDTPESGEARAIGLRTQGRFPEALEALTAASAQASAQGRSFLAADVMRVDLLLRQGKVQEARRLAKDLRERLGDDPTLLRLSAEAHASDDAGLGMTSDPELLAEAIGALRLLQDLTEGHDRHGRGLLAQTLVKAKRWGTLAEVCVGASPASYWSPLRCLALLRLGREAEARAEARGFEARLSAEAQSRGFQLEAGVTYPLLKKLLGPDLSNEQLGELLRLFRD
jgi:serine/threonine protein kinase